MLEINPKNIEKRTEDFPLQLFNPKNAKDGKPSGYGVTIKFIDSVGMGQCVQFIQLMSFSGGLGIIKSLIFVFSSVAMTASPILGVSGHQIKPKPSETCSFLPTNIPKSEGIAIAGISVGEN